jgi:hypothetical protein
VEAIRHLRYLNTTNRVFGRLVMALLILSLASTAMPQDGKIDFQDLPLPRNLALSDGHSNSVIRSAQEWDGLLSDSTDGAEHLPVIDFEHYTLLVVNAGYRTQGPFAVKFDSVIDVGNEVRVHVTVTGPEICPQVSQAAHYAAMVLIPRTDKPIQFDVSTRDSGCHRQ